MSDKPKKYDEFIRAFEIFRKYPQDEMVTAEHDEVYAGPDPRIVSDEDKAELEKLGWTPKYTWFRKYV